MRTGQPVVNAEIGVHRPDGGLAWLLVTACPRGGGDGGEPTEAVVSFTDVSSTRSRIPFEQVVHNATDAVVVTEAAPLREGGPRVVYTNPAFERLTGYPAEEMIGQTPRILQHDGTDPEARERIHEQLSRGLAVREELSNVHRDGREYWIELDIFPLHDAEGRVTHFAAFEREITERKAAERELSDLALLDPLTGIPNRRAFVQRARSVVGHTAERVALAVLDVDHFKRVNDTHGHPGGDVVLSRLARTLSDGVRDSDLVARFGGEEFVVMLVGTDEEQALRRIEHLRKTVSQCVVELPSGAEVQVSLSAGLVAVDRASHATLDDLLAQADAALYEAKESGRDRVCVA
jgi:diguanylate cyclase (GGDEF)-like protein/PAS domain S-box-containing protein